MNLVDVLCMCVTATDQQANHVPVRLCCSRIGFHESSMMDLQLAG
jgi:hypothetical protein